MKVDQSCFYSRFRIGFFDCFHSYNLLSFVIKNSYFEDELEIFNGSSQ